METVLLFPINRLFILCALCAYDITASCNNNRKKQNNIMKAMIRESLDGTRYMFLRNRLKLILTEEDFPKISISKILEEDRSMRNDKSIKG